MKLHILTVNLKLVETKEVHYKNITQFSCHLSHPLLMIRILNQQNNNKIINHLTKTIDSIALAAKKTLNKTVVKAVYNTSMILMIMNLLNTSN